MLFEPAEHEVVPNWTSHASSPEQSPNPDLQEEQEETANPPPLVVPIHSVVLCFVVKHVEFLSHQKFALLSQNGETESEVAKQLTIYPPLIDPLSWSVFDVVFPAGAVRLFVSKHCATLVRDFAQK